MGGRAFDNVVPVPKETVTEISLWIACMFELSDIDEDHYEISDLYLGFLRSSRGLIDNLHELFLDNGLRWLGSSGKKHLSGDIDIAVSSDTWTISSLESFLSLRLGSDNVKVNGSLNQIYARVEVYGYWYQVDFMIGDVDLLEFTHWSPVPGSSSYSGSHRTELIKCVAKALSDWTLVMPSDHEYNPGEMVGRLGYTLNHDKGLVHGGRYAPLRKDGKGYVKKMIPVTIDNVQDFIGDFFPSYLVWGWESRYSEEELITKTSTDPKFISQQLFGVGVMPEALNSYEEVAEAIFANAELCKHIDLIWLLYVERLEEIGQPIPTSLNELLVIRRSN